MISRPKYDLEERLISFAVSAITLVTSLKKDRVGQHLGGQLLRSGSSPALNYAEALAAESTKDFIHKIKIVLKELRETMVCIRILVRINFVTSNNPIIKECDELIAIFTKSTSTLKKKQMQNSEN